MKVVFGCVAENNGKYLSQALRLLQSLRWFGGRLADSDFMVCLAGDNNGDHASEFTRYGATTRVVERVSSLHPQSNKLRFLEQPEIKDYDMAVLLDCDTVIVQDMYEKIAGTRCLKAKIADISTAPLPVLAKIFEVAGFEVPAAEYRCVAPENQ